MALLSWDLVSPSSYSTGEELIFALHFEAPTNTTPRKLYILGGLYTDITHITGSLFGILKSAEVDYGVNSASYATLWELGPGKGIDLPCKFTLNRSNCLLALLLMRMVGSEVNLDDDEVAAQISAQLVTPKPTWEQFQDMISQNIVPLAAMGLLLWTIVDISKEEKEED